MRRPLPQRGFTLVEMMVIAPIVILLIGSFVALLVNLTGEVMSSRGSNVLAYDVQDALNRIDSDVRLSTTFLATNNIDVSSTKQGYSDSPSPTGGTTNFTNIDMSGSGGTHQSIILSGLVTTGNPVSSQASLVYRANQPNTCSNPDEYSKNTPMTMNVVYFIDNTNTLWRRVIMPSDYANTANYCGSDAPWQLPTCINGYDSVTLTFCKSNDEKLVSGVSPSDFTFSYYTSASSSTADPTASNASVTSNSTRNTALRSTPTIDVSITARQTIAGREISRSGTLRSTRLDTNASSIGTVAAVTAAPSNPVVSGSVSDGHKVTFTWPRIATATSYTLEYRINSGSWQTGATNIDNNSRSYAVTAGTHTDAVEARVLATNSFGNSGYGTKSVTIPLWAPLALQGDWTDFGSPYSTAAYTKTKSGVVMFKGMIKNTNVATSLIGLLPADYAPSGRLIFGTSANNAAARVDVDASGQILMVVGDAAWTSLETIRYLPGNTSYTKTAVSSFLNGATNTGGEYQTAFTAQDSVGRAHIQGLVTPGSWTDNTAMFTLPTAVRPTYALHFASYSTTGGFSNIGISTTSVTTKGVGSGSLSINAMYLPSSFASWNALTLQNSWVNYSASYSADYAKTSDNVVTLRGLIRSGSTTTGSVIANLPSGFRPKSRILLTTANNSNAYARVDINTNGDIFYYGSSNVWFSLDRISFYAEQ